MNQTINENEKINSEASENTAQAEDIKACGIEMEPAAAETAAQTAEETEAESAGKSAAESEAVETEAAGETAGAESKEETAGAESKEETAGTEEADQQKNGCPDEDPEEAEEAEAGENGTESGKKKGFFDKFRKADSEKKEEDEELQVRYMRLAADFQNFRNRTEREKSDIYARANEKMATDLLDVLDNFERAIEAAEKDSKFAEGMQLILKQLQDVMAKHGVTEIEALGKPFDPNFHNAVMQDSEGESGTVTKVLQKGYMLHNRVIRPSMVAVAQ